MQRYIWPEVVACVACFNTASGKCCCNCAKYIITTEQWRSFNTASGKCCCNLTMLMIMRHRIISFNTASGKCCCNYPSMLEMRKQSLVSIPQAVSAVATGNGDGLYVVSDKRFNTASGKCCCNLTMLMIMRHRIISFNTASGKCCCNAALMVDTEFALSNVSIPQAVSAVATQRTMYHGLEQSSNRFNTASGKCCCNHFMKKCLNMRLLKFQYRKR